MNTLRIGQDDSQHLASSMLFSAFLGQRQTTLLVYRERIILYQTSKNSSLRIESNVV